MFSELVSLVPGIENKKQEREVQKYSAEIPAIGLVSLSLLREMRQMLRSNCPPK